MYLLMRLFRIVYEKVRCQMKYFVDKSARAIAAIQLSLLLLWVVLFPLHVIFDQSDSDHKNSSAISHHENSCCGHSCATSANFQTTKHLQGFKPVSFCGICDFAAQFASSDLAVIFSFQFFAAFSSSSSEAYALLTASDFLFYDSRAPPSELIS
ncbi:MAG: hypothetical protein ACD_39C01098G0001 [uncultured bacterium]|nr:MAG: hypothetical protein ACD_39C01098G0001 [uncultured bacterium]